MSNVLPPQDPSYKKKRAWIGVLGTKVDEEAAQSDYEQVRKALDEASQKDDPRKLPKLLDSSSLGKARKVDVDRQLEELDTRVATCEYVCQADVFEKVEKAADKARLAAAQDLGDTANNDAVRAALQDAIELADKTLNAYAEGFGEFTKTMSMFVGSILFADAVEKKASLHDEYVAVWTKGVGGDIPGALIDLAKLKIKCEEEKNGLRLRKERQETLKNRLELHQTGYQTLNAPEVGDAIKSRIRELWGAAVAACNAEVEEDSEFTVAQGLIAEIAAIIVDFDGDPVKVEKKSKFLNPYSFVTEHYTAAEEFETNASLVAGKQKADDNHGAENYDDESVEQVVQLKNDIAEILKKAQVAWKQELKDAGPAIRFLKNLAAANAPPEDIDVPDQRSAERKTAESTALAALARYDAAHAHAGKMEFGSAISELNAAAGAGQDLKEKAAAERDKVVKSTAAAAASEKEAFNILVYRPDDRSFDTNRDALLYMTGQIFDPEDGSMQMSDELKKMYAAQAEASKRWHQLTDSGVDPISAGETAFKNIPKNFWPPEAVRAVAMYRKAVAEFEDEERVKELEASLAARAVDAASGVAKDTRAKFAIDAVEVPADVIKKVLADDFTSKIKSAHPNWTDKQVADETAKEMGKTDLGQAAVGLGAVATSLKLLSGIANVASDTNSLVNKQAAKDASGEDKIDPVALKIAEFERNRAIMHLALDVADLITNVGGALNNLVPGLGIANDALGMAQSMMEAGRYFQMLGEAKDLKKGAKKDPETMMHLALAKEVKDSRLFAYQKAFDAAIALSKVVGGALELAGPAATAGFAIKKGTVVLQYCGAACFQVKSWGDAASCKSTLAAAKKQPVDYLAVEGVFKESQKFARFALAYGCVESNDPWARQYVIGRGLTDADLDHPETTHTIVREYLNITFEGLSGDTQEDKERDKTFKESLPFVGKKYSQENGPPPHKLLTDEPDLELLKLKDPFGYANNVDDTGDWTAESPAELKQAYWEDNFSEAVSSGMYNDKKVYKTVNAALPGYVAAFLAATDPRQKYEDVVDECKATPPTKTRDDYLAALADAREKVQAEISQLRYLHQQLAAFKPSTRNGKKIHKEGYNFQKALLQLVLERLTECTADLGRFQDDEFVVGTAPDEDAQSLARAVYQDADDEFMEKLKEFQEEATRVFMEAWDATDFALPWGGKAKLPELALAAFDKFDLQAPADKELHEALKKESKQAVEVALLTLTSPSQQYLNPPPQGETPKLAAKREKARLKKMNSEVKVRCAFTAKAVESAFAALCSKAVTDRDELTFDLKNERDLDVAAWYANTTKKDHDGWVRQKTGIGECLTKFQDADAAWNAIKGDIYTQRDWRMAHAELQGKIKVWKPVTADGIAHPTMTKYRSSLFRATVDARAKFEKEIQNAEKPATEDGVWTPKATDFNGFPLTNAAWKSFKALAVNHGWNKRKAPNGTEKCFAQLEKTSGEYEIARKAFDEDQTPIPDKIKDAYKKALDKLKEKLEKVKKDKFKATSNYAVAMIKKCNDAAP